MQPSNAKKVKGVDTNFDYKKYWEDRYAKGQNSGSGSYGDNAAFKAKIIDRVIQENNIQSVVDFGCGDGNQISLIKSKIKYTGYDISETAITKCENKFKNDSNKDFLVYDPMEYIASPYFDMSMCLDCLFHVSKEEDWLKTINDVCTTATKVILIVTNTEVIQEEYFPHVNFKRKILPVLDCREDVIIDEVITQPTHKESNTIILRKVTHG